MKSQIGLLACMLLTALPTAAAEYDLVIRNGRVIDGTGHPAFRADVAVKDGRIVAVGRNLPGRGADEIDAAGLHVAPGFIDVHTHAENIVGNPPAENFLRMGVTTLVLGNCGSSQVDLESFFGTVTETGCGPNVSSLIGHNAIRRVVIGGAIDRDPTADELEKMKALVDKAMRDGALGLSTGLIYQPGTYSKTPEIVELAKVASAHGGLYVSHMRSEGAGIMRALEELFTIAREANIPAQVSHIKVSGKNAWGMSSEVLEVIEQRRAEGLDITQDQYLYTASSTGLRQLIPVSAREGSRDAFRKRIADPAQKQRIKDGMLRRLRSGARDDFGYATIAFFRADTSLNGLSVPEAAKRHYGNDSLEAQMDLILDIEARGGASAVFHGMHEDDVRTFISHPNTMIASDSGVRAFESGMPHPRGYGNSARALARYVRELQILRLEEAVRRMTSLPATTFQLPGRGQIAPGFAADLVVFDPASVQDHATFVNPHQYATGFSRVIVNGVVVIENDTLTEALPGRVLRRATL
jgi:N-acyl-D-amino-acid deacylase